MVHLFVFLALLFAVAAGSRAKAALGAVLFVAPLSHRFCSTIRPFPYLPDRAPLLLPLQRLELLRADFCLRAYFVYETFLLRDLAAVACQPAGVIVALLAT